MNATIRAVALITLAWATGSHHVAPRAAEHDARSDHFAFVDGLLRWDGVPYDGVVIEHDSAGAVISRTPYAQGRREGVAQGWYSDGRAMFRREYRNGREEGAHLGWWQNGRARFAYRYHDGLLEGEAREWFADGRRFREFHYLHGQEEGSQQMWYSDGRLRANYVVRSGRRYGLPGTKGCSGANDRRVGA